MSCNIADDTGEDILMSVFFPVRQKEFLPFVGDKGVEADLPSV